MYGGQAFQPPPSTKYDRASRIESNNFIQHFIRHKPQLFLPTPQYIYNPASQPYMHDTSSFRPVGKVTDREYWLSPVIHGFPNTWLKHLEAPLTSTNGFRCFELYPLNHHRRILSDWDMAHPGEYYPCEIRWNLNNLRGNVDDDCPPPYYLLTLIAAAINGSPEAKATNKEIRLTIMLRYNYFITQSTLHEEVDLTLKHFTLYFKSYPRHPTDSDDGCLWGLTDSVARTIADTVRNLPPPLLPVEPPVRLNCSKELDPDRKIVTGPVKEYSDPAKIKPKRLDVDEIKSVQPYIPRQHMDIFMRQEGRRLLQEWGVNH